MAYVRIASPRVRSDWNPVKLTEVFKSSSIDIVDDILDLPRTFEAGIRGELATDTPQALLVWITCLTDFGKALNDAYGSPASDTQIVEAVNQAVITTGDFTDLEDRRRTFDVVAEVVASSRKNVGTEVDGGDIEFQPQDTSVVFREHVRNLREAAMSRLLEAFEAPEIDPEAVKSSTLPNKAQLEVEFVAIYW